QAHRAALTDRVAASLAAIRASRACLERESAALIVMNERGYTPMGEFFDTGLLASRRVVQYCASHRDDARVFKAYSIDTRTEHPNSLSAGEWAAAQSAGLDREDEE